MTEWVYKEVARLKIGIIAKEVKRGRLKKRYQAVDNEKVYASWHEW